MTPHQLRDLEMDVERAYARLATAEDFGWGLGWVTGVAAYLWLYSWWGAILAGVVMWRLSIHSYQKRYETLNDTYERATGTGKHYRHPDRTPPAAHND